MQSSLNFQPFNKRQGDHLAQRKPRQFTENDVLKLLSYNRPLGFLVETRSGFEEFVKSRPYMSNDGKVDYSKFASLMEILCNGCSVPRISIYEGKLQKLLGMISGCQSFLFNDALFAISNSMKGKLQLDLPKFISNFTSVLMALLRNENPTDADCRKYVIESILPILKNFMDAILQGKYRNMDDAKKNYEKLQKAVTRLGTPITEEEEQDLAEAAAYTSLSIVPRDDDVVNHQSLEHIPVNKVDGPYRSEIHYLSVHFRLMREDMLRSFRDSIRLCTLSSNFGSKTSTRKYDKVNAKFPPNYSPRGITYKLTVESATSIDWTKQRILMPGNMVCLTPDQFRSVVFATITREVKRPSDKSKCFRMEVKLEDDSYRDVLEANSNYMMVESDAYFECYKHILSAIKDFDGKNLPLSDILIFFRFDQVEPEYLLHHDIRYCLEDTCSAQITESIEDDRTCSGQKTEEDKANDTLERVENSHKTIENCVEDHMCNFNPLNHNVWPEKDELGLDPQQLNAFKLALSRKVALIQGPPGTGKTYIGKKIVRAFLKNVPGLKPIVVCCMTNHALDQFLEGILMFEKNVIRLGSQSKSEKLKPHTLEYLKLAFKDYKKNQSQNSNKARNTDKAFAKSLNYLMEYAPSLLHDTEFDYGDGKSLLELESLRSICHQLNNTLKMFNLCKNNFLEQDALNSIIPRHAKLDLESHPKTHGFDIQRLMIEWLKESEVNELKDLCLRRFQRCAQGDSEKISNEDKGKNVWSLELNVRFCLFYEWQEKCLRVLQNKIDGLKEDYCLMKRSYELQDDNSFTIDLLQGAAVVGVTTTGAAKFRQILKVVRPKILVVEEAAEVLESHIIASLLPSVQHLILIGDHKQLRPLPANHELSELCNLKISMFERLFNNGAPSATLVLQHRMRPQISSLLVNEELYEDLGDDPSVFHYPEVRGIGSSVFFLEHEAPESEVSSTSSANPFEAHMIALMAKYFCYQGYKPDQITILATYAAQVPLIENHLKAVNLEDIKLTTVDNYQGEENDIIFVSFVRSNRMGNIGFLYENNRVCVALSRAKHGMFCLGNFRSYAQKTNLWQSIIEKLEKQNAIGKAFPLLCSRHGTSTDVSTPEEVRKFLLQGCSEDCAEPLGCGHKCSRKCHFDDQEHLRFRCKEPCQKMIGPDKQCPKLCYERCKRSKLPVEELPCGHQAQRKKDGTTIKMCFEEVQRILRCRHEVTLCCYVDMATYDCTGLVKKILPCGHENLVPCHSADSDFQRTCRGNEQVIGPCGHIVFVPCGSELSDDEVLSYCEKPCDQLLSCGHICSGNCRRCFDIGIHVSCHAPCDLKLPCGHPCKGKCNAPCPPCLEQCFLSCSHAVPCCNRCYRECVPCKKPCQRRCQHVQCSRRCHEECDVKPCLLPCIEIQPCGHQCIGLCGDPCPHLCRVCKTSDLRCGEDPLHDLYVELEDCCHVVEVTALTKHIEDLLDGEEWPACPVCQEPIKSSLRFKTQLFQAKRTAISAGDCSKQADNFNYKYDCLFDVDYGELDDGHNAGLFPQPRIVPFRFLAVTRDIDAVIRKNPSSDVLIVLDHAVSFLRKLVRIDQRIATQPFEPRHALRFEALLSWVSMHLKQVSFQQIQESLEATKLLETEVCARRGNG